MLNLRDADADDAIFAEINVTPLVDVVLVLLIIFMVTANAMAPGQGEGRLDVSLPQAASAAAPSAARPTLVIGMAADGRLFVDGHFLAPAALAALLADTQQHAPTTSVVLDADGGLSHRAVVDVLDQVRSAGFEAVSIGANNVGAAGAAG